MSKKCPLNIKPKKSHFKIKPKSITSKTMKIKPKSILSKKEKPKKHPKNVSHTSKKCPLNVPPRKVLKPKTFFCKNVL